MWCDQRRLPKVLQTGFWESERGGAVQFFIGRAVESLSCLYKYSDARRHARMHVTRKRTSRAAKEDLDKKKKGKMRILSTQVSVFTDNIMGAYRELWACRGVQ